MRAGVRVVVNVEGWWDVYVQTKERGTRSLSYKLEGEKGLRIGRNIGNASVLRRFLQGAGSGFY